MRWPGLLEAYKEYLPVSNETPLLILNEGNTPFRGVVQDDSK
jgi:threonine synthase